MKLWASWVLATALSFALGGRLGRASSPVEDPIVVGYLALATSLVLAGALQGFLLRSLIPTGASWVLVTGAGVGAIGLLAFGLGLLDRDVGWVLGVAMGWVLIGVLQWLVLRGTVAGAGWWIVAHAMALVVAVPLVGLVTWLTGSPADTPTGGVVRWLAFGAAYGTVSGTMLWWLLKERLLLAT